MQGNWIAYILDLSTVVAGVHASSTVEVSMCATCATQCWKYLLACFVVFTINAHHFNKNNPERVPSNRCCVCVQHVFPNDLLIFHQPPPTAFSTAERPELENSPLFAGTFGVR